MNNKLKKYIELTDREIFLIKNKAIRTVGEEAFLRFIGKSESKAKRTISYDIIDL